MFTLLFAFMPMTTQVGCLKVKAVHMTPFRSFIQFIAQAAKSWLACRGVLIL